MNMDRISPAAELTFQKQSDKYIVLDDSGEQIGSVGFIEANEIRIVANVDYLDKDIGYTAYRPVRPFDEDCAKYLWDDVGKRYRSDYITAIRAASMRDVFIKKSDNLTISEIDSLPKLTDKDKRNIVEADRRARQQNSTSTLEGMFDK